MHRNGLSWVKKKVLKNDKKGQLPFVGGKNMIFIRKIIMNIITKVFPIVRRTWSSGAK